MLLANIVRACSGERLRRRDLQSGAGLAGCGDRECEFDGKDDHGWGDITENVGMWLGMVWGGWTGGLNAINVWDGK